jgi:hypothetical protein
MVAYFAPCAAMFVGKLAVSESVVTILLVFKPTQGGENQPGPNIVPQRANIAKRLVSCRIICLRVKRSEQTSSQHHRCIPGFSLGQLFYLDYALQSQSSTINRICTKLYIQGLRRHLIHMPVLLSIAFSPIIMKVGERHALSLWPHRSGFACTM